MQLLRSRVAAGDTRRCFPRAAAFVIARQNDDAKNAQNITVKLSKALINI
jgi:hypothetical protein